MAQKKATTKRTPAKHIKRLKHHVGARPISDFVSAFVLLVVAYILASLAIDSGSLLQWAGTIVAIVWGVRRLIGGVIELVTN